MPCEHIRNIQKYLRDDEKAIADKDGISVTYHDIEIIGHRRAGLMTEEWCQFEERIKHMDEFKVDLAILSLSAWQEWNTPAICSFINDEMARVTKEYSGRFVGLAHVPARDPMGTDELDRAVKDLGLSGVCITTHTDELYPDADELQPFFKKVSELDVPVLVHAASLRYLVEHKILSKYDLFRDPLGRFLEATLAVVYPLYSGLLSKYSNLKFIHTHLSAFAFLKRAFKEALRQHNPDLPFDDYLERLYFVASPPSYAGRSELMCAIENLGADHIMMGTDYPLAYADKRALGYPAKSLKDAINTVLSLDISEEDKQKILGGNAARLFHQ